MASKKKLSTGKTRTRKAVRKTAKRSKKGRKEMRAVPSLALFAKFPKASAGSNVAVRNSEESMLNLDDDCDNEVYKMKIVTRRKFNFSKIATTVPQGAEAKTLYDEMTDTIDIKKESM